MTLVGSVRPIVAALMALMTMAVAARAQEIIVRALAAGVSVSRLGTTGGDALTLKGDRPILVAKLRESFESWFPAYMGGGSPGDRAPEGRALQGRGP